MSSQAMTNAMNIRRIYIGIFDKISYFRADYFNVISCFEIIRCESALLPINNNNIYVFLVFKRCL